MLRRLVPVLVAALALAGAGAAAGRIGAAAPSVTAYPESTTIAGTGRLPSGGGRSVTLNEPIGGDEGGMVVVANAKRISAAVDSAKLSPLHVQLRFWHFVRFGSKLVPDALMPWDGSAIAAEQQNQPLSVEVQVPYGTRPGTYSSSVTVTADGRATALPLKVTVYNVQLPKPGQVSGSLLTVFGVGPQSYVNKVIDLYHTPDDQIRTMNAGLFGFLSAERISPDSWGYGIPGASGYVASRSWWKDSAGNMALQIAAGGFPNLWIPLSNNRAGRGSDVAGVDPLKPSTWCGYLGTVAKYWNEQGWLKSGAIPYAYPYDEPGTTHTTLLAEQAAALHKCFPGSKMLITATPDPKMARLYDGKGSDDVDMWAAVDWRYYGVFTSPAKQKCCSRKHQYIDQIDKARSHGKKILAYTYYGVPGFPSFSVVEPLSNPRMFVLWTALEGIDGILYGQGLTTYKSGNPLTAANDSKGESLLIYPGATSPIPSARLEQIHDGIEDWEVFNVVRKRFGAAKVRQILGSHGLFSADAQGVKLACVVGCDLKGVPPQAWPQWSHDSSTPGRIEAAVADALKAASS